MTQKVPLALISPHLRFALADVIAFPQNGTIVGDLEVLILSCLRGWPMAPAYLRYADRDAELLVLRPDEPVDLERELADVIHALGESGELDDLGMAIVLLDAVDSCFRECGLWGGNVYLAGGGALTAALQIGGVDVSRCREPVMVMRELAALQTGVSVPGRGQVSIWSVRRAGPVPPQRVGKGASRATRGGADSRAGRRVPSADR